MKKLFNQLLLITIAATANLAAAQAIPAPSKTQGPQWYQIELLIFAHGESAHGSEQWPTELRLKYPNRIIALQQSSDDQITLNDWTDDQQPLAPLANETPELTTAEPQALTASKPPPVKINLQQQPFTQLDEEQHSFSQLKRKLFRQVGFRQLFHASWRQPINPRDSADSILIRGGDMFDQRYELEGSVSIGLERYLHISTDLWLSTFVSNAGRSDNLWPVLPKLPITSNANNSRSQHELTNKDIFAAIGSGDNNSANIPFDNPFSQLSANQYVVDRTVALRQQRRMRSNELHYIDHPLMGLLIKITAYDFPEVDSEQVPLDEQTAADTESTP
ncbi:MAG: hypothetical protein ACJAYG_001927 [Oceanicoccus sp.]|jgi:hypothetical protein